MDVGHLREARSLLVSKEKNLYEAVKLNKLQKVVGKVASLPKKKVCVIQVKHDRPRIWSQL